MHTIIQTKSIMKKYGTYVIQYKIYSEKAVLIQVLNIDS